MPQLVAREGMPQLVAPEGTSQLVAPEGTIQLVAPEGTTQLVAPEGTTQLVVPEGMSQIAGPVGTVGKAQGAGPDIGPGEWHMTAADLLQSGTAVFPGRTGHPRHRALLLEEEEEDSSQQLLYSTPDCQMNTAALAADSDRHHTVHPVPPDSTPDSHGLPPHTRTAQRNSGSSTLPPSHTNRPRYLEGT